MALAHAHLLYHVGAHGLTNQQVKKQDASVRACSYSAMTGVHRDHLVLTSDGQWPRYSIFCLGVKSFLLTLSYWQTNRWTDAQPDKYNLSIMIYTHKTTSWLSCIQGLLRLTLNHVMYVYNSLSTRNSIIIGLSSVSENMYGMYIRVVHITSGIPSRPGPHRVHVPYISMGEKLCTYARCSLLAILPDIPILWISTKSTNFPSPCASCHIFWKWSIAELQSIKDGYIWYLYSPGWLTNSKSKPFMVVAIDLEVEK